jgi:hypothetical protein
MCLPQSPHLHINLFNLRMQMLHLFSREPCVTETSKELLSPGGQLFFLKEERLCDLTISSSVMLRTSTALQQHSRSNEYGDLTQWPAA